LQTRYRTGIIIHILKLKSYIFPHQSSNHLIFELNLVANKQKH